MTKKEKKQKLEKVKKELPPQKSENELLKEQLEDHKNRFLRALADLENYKKRAANERDALIQFSNEQLIRAILPIIDNFERALGSIGKEKVSDDFAKGLALIKKQIEDALKKFGVEDIQAQNQPFDANLHEAIMQKGSDQPENTVLEVAQKGYMLHSRLLRPAMVIISAKEEK